MAQSDAGGQLVNAGYSLIGEVSPAATKMRNRTLADADRLKYGQLGLSDAEKQRAMAMAARQAGASTGTTRAELVRGGPMSGATYNTLGQQTVAQQGAIAQAAGQQEAASASLAMNQRADILNRLDTEANHGRGIWQRVGDKWEGAMKSAGDKVSGGDASSKLDMKGLQSMFGGSSGGP